MFINKIPDRYIPIQNVFICFISAFICYFSGIEKNFITSFVTCFLASTSAGGLSDLLNVIKKPSIKEDDVG